MNDNVLQDMERQIDDIKLLLEQQSRLANAAHVALLSMARTIHAERVQLRSLEHAEKNADLQPEQEALASRPARLGERIVTGIITILLLLTVAGTVQAGERTTRHQRAEPTPATRYPGRRTHRRLSAAFDTASRNRQARRCRCEAAEQGEDEWML